MNKRLRIPSSVLNARQQAYSLTRIALQLDRQAPDADDELTKIRYAFARELDRDAPEQRWNYARICAELD